MDNDHKVIIQKPEVQLFLQDDVYAFNREKPQVYDLEKEFSKVKKNKKHTIFWPLIILFIFSIFVTIGVSYYINQKNKQISVNVDVFEDLNLKNLLNMVSRLESKIQQNTASRTRLEERQKTELENLVATKDSEIFTVQSLPISVKEKQGKISEIEKKYESAVISINNRYETEIQNLDLELAELQQQLNEYDSANVERAHAQQAAIDSQRKVFEIEKEELSRSYESTINDLEKQISDLKASEISLRIQLTEEISKEYQAQYEGLKAELSAKIDSLDPFVTDEKYTDILTRTRKLSTVESESSSQNTVEISDFDSELLENSVENPKKEDIQPPSDVEPTFVFLDEATVPENLQEKYQEILALSTDYDRATELLLSLPQENDIPQYVQAMDLINSQISNSLLETCYDLSMDFKKKAEEYTLESQNLKNALTESQNLNDKLTEANFLLSEKNLILEKMYSYFEHLALESGDSGYIIDITNKEKLLVYISPLFSQEIDSTFAYVFRKSDELIGTLILIKEGDFYYGIPSSNEIAQKIKPGDKIILDVHKQE